MFISVKIDLKFSVLKNINLLIKMSDYSFLKSGHNLVDEPKKFNQKEQENIMIMLSLFSSNALINGAKYCELCERDGVTKEDLVYGMRYEVFEFLKRDNLMESMDEMAKDYYEEMKNKSEDEEIEEEEMEEEEIEDEDIDEQEMDEEDMDQEDIDDLVVPDSEIEPFERIKTDKLNKLKIDDKDFVGKMHNYYDNWDTWNPETPLEKILKNGIDKMI